MFSRNVFCSAWWIQRLNISLQQSSSRTKHLDIVVEVENVVVESEQSSIRTASLPSNLVTPDLLIGNPSEVKGFAVLPLLGLYSQYEIILDGDGGVDDVVLRDDRQLVVRKAAGRGRCGGRGKGQAREEDREREMGKHVVFLLI